MILSFSTYFPQSNSLYDMSMFLQLAYPRVPFLWLGNVSIAIYVPYLLFPFSVDGCLGACPCLSIMKQCLQKHFGVVCFEIMVFFSLHDQVGCGSYDSLILVLRTSLYCSHSVCLNLHSIIVQGFHFSLLSAFIVVRFFDNWPLLTILM